MQSKETEAEINIGEMHGRREKMADGRRYIIYYTFEGDEKSRTDAPADDAKTEKKDV